MYLHRCYMIRWPHQRRVNVLLCFLSALVKEKSRRLWIVKNMVYKPHLLSKHYLFHLQFKVWSLSQFELHFKKNFTIVRNKIWEKQLNSAPFIQTCSTKWKLKTTQKKIRSILQDYEFAYNNKKKVFKKKTNRQKYNTRDKKCF